MARPTPDGFCSIHSDPEHAAELGRRSGECRRLPESAVVALDRAVNLISEGYFDGHDVLFADSQKELTRAYETARFLIVAYNCFAEENGKELIDTEAIERFLHDGRTMDLLNAIQQHSSPGSEANRVVRRFNDLSPADQQALLDFLRSL